MAMLGESFQDNSLSHWEEMELRNRIKDLEAILDKRSSKAFPLKITDGWNPSEMGMDLRDYFAARAMASISSRMQTEAGDFMDEDYTFCAERSYKFADALMKARKK